MRIVNLVENTPGAPGCGAAHGLCFYIETPKHRLLMDLGPSASILENAARLGIDLTKVDTVVLSHGHNDHGGGILPFAKLNPDAKMKKYILDKHYNRKHGSKAYYGQR